MKPVKRPVKSMPVDAVVNNGFACEADMQVELWRCRADMASSIRLIYGLIIARSAKKKLWDDYSNGNYNAKALSVVNANSFLTESMLMDVLNVGIDFCETKMEPKSDQWRIMMETYCAMGKKAKSRYLDFQISRDLFTRCVQTDG